MDINALLMDLEYIYSSEISQVRQETNHSSTNLSQSMFILTKFRKCLPTIDETDDDDDVSNGDDEVYARQC